MKKTCVLYVRYMFPIHRARACRGSLALTQTHWKPWPKNKIQGAFEEQLAHLQVLTVDGDVKNVPWSKGHGPWEGCHGLVMGSDPWRTCWMMHDFPSWDSYHTHLKKKMVMMNSTKHHRKTPFSKIQENTSWSLTLPKHQKPTAQRTGSHGPLMINISLFSHQNIPSGKLT